MKKERYDASITAQNIAGMKKLLNELKSLIGNATVKPCYRNLMRDTRELMEIAVASIFNVEDKINSLTNVVKKYMDEYGKYPKFTDTIKASNYIRNIVGNIDEVEQIRLNILYEPLPKVRD